MNMIILLKESNCIFAHAGSFIFIIDQLIAVCIAACHMLYMHCINELCKLYMTHVDSHSVTFALAPCTIAQLVY